MCRLQGTSPVCYVLIETCASCGNLVPFSASSRVKSLLQLSIKIKAFSSVVRAAGKIYMFYSPSQERVRHGFSSQEGAIRIFYRKDAFPGQKIRGRGEKTMISRTRQKTEENFPGREDCDKSWKVNGYIPLLQSSYTLFHVSQEGLASSERIFQRTAVVDCSVTFLLDCSLNKYSLLQNTRIAIQR